MASKIDFVLVTGATGFIGAHVIDTLLARGRRVRGATRSLAKGEEMIRSRPQYSQKLEFVQIQDFENPGGLTEAVNGVDAVIHVASPFKLNTSDNEKELIIPAINGVRAMLEAASNAPSVQRVVITSSFAAVIDTNRKGPQGFTYTAADWNPLTYEEAADPKSTPVVAYRGSKKYAELAAWGFVKEKKPHFDIVTLCPPMVFGPIAHPIDSLDHLNESNAALWDIAKGVDPLPVGRVPFWIDARDLAIAHVEAALRKEAGGKRYTPAAPERWSYALAAKYMVSHFPELCDEVKLEEQVIDDSFSLDGETAAREFGYRCRRFEETIRDFTAQCLARKGRT
ncbi:NAD dependent epimerase/dehydratase, putative [Talaromyces stipitatus ATCC 10500]|uniref:NAD dependent epimerase/dehydratase, putative n=1 Tax=Talaromyces stipitatus (strain ATCC 10500 / CBS 375.48 / QM 6759 / NRRL 1006) TaxID=441959 RepID=B8MHW6_TALSN|nr:NAD dependent epimerase/dehydratase, putative [Talaromyces stipitatus ATCC 10500]EED16446.1 NAD dependent epimerase/dehydratase, putative [Talaromyces stipitatus ATCC 10500]